MAKLNNNKIKSAKTLCFKIFFNSQNLTKNQEKSADLHTWFK
jgi:hypothetical protein